MSKAPKNHTLLGSLFEHLGAFVKFSFYVFFDTLLGGIFVEFGAQRPPKRVPLGTILMTFPGPVEKVKMDVLWGRELHFGGRRGPGSKILLFVWYLLEERSPGRHF